MKRFTYITILVLSLVSRVWSGEMELKPIDTDLNPALNNAIFLEERRGGDILKFSWDADWDVDYSFLIIDGDLCYSMDDNEIIGDAALTNNIKEMADLFTSASGIECTMGRENFSSIYVQELNVHNWSQFSNPLLGIDESSVKVFLDNLELGSHSYELFLIESSGRATLVEFQFTAEFFPGEGELFELAGSGRYDENVLGFMLGFFDDPEDRAEFLTLANTSFGANKTRVESLDEDFQAVEGIDDYRNRFKESFRQRFSILEEERGDLILPYMNTDYIGFEEIYSENGSIYIQAYMSFLFHEKINKPVLSSIFEDRLDGEVEYNYRNYRAINSIEGLELANNAIRYLLWGVEYLGDNLDLQALVSNSNEEVYISIPEDWSIGAKERIRDNNYLPEGVVLRDYDQLNSPLSSVQAIEGDAFDSLYNSNAFTPFDSTTFQDARIEADIPDFLLPNGGNPLPYAPLGIDTPRSFYHKMVHQRIALEWLNDEERLFLPPRITTLPIGSPTEIFRIQDPDSINPLFQNYMDFSEREDNKHRPYLPGTYQISRLGYEDDSAVENSYNPNKIAGVDGVGLLCGAMSMSSSFDGFTNALNEAPAENMNDYQSFLVGKHELLGADGYPIYAGNLVDQILDANLRFSASDLERSTLIVPSIAEVQRGDLLVHYQDDGEMELGIIVGCVEDPQGLSTQELMEQIFVLSVRKEFGAVTLGTWGNPEGGFGGFTDRPQNYHIRRLLVENTQPHQGPADLDSWELVDFSMSGLDVQILYESVTDNEGPWRWISNAQERNQFDRTTYEADNERAIGIGIEEIQIKALFPGNEEPQLLADPFREIELLPPVDPYFDEEKPASEYGNIYNNQGEGIAFYVQVPNEGDSTFPGRYLIAEMRRQLDGSYILDYSNSAFDNGIEGLDEENRFYVTPYTDGRLYFRGRLTDENSWVNSSRFMVTALQDGDIRPGDDFLLQFALKEKSSVTGTASEEDFCAVYDHKMLWRANLYMDEGPGDLDWNNRHPWNSVENEWNRVLTSAEYDSFVGNCQLSFLDVDPNGGQVIEIPEYSPVRTGANNIGTVSYDYPEGDISATDSPFDFVYKLLRQQENIEHYYGTLDQSDSSLMPSGDNPELDNSALAEWGTTIAPFNKWINYRREPSGVFQAFLPGVGLYEHDSDHGDLSEGLANNFGTIIDPFNSILSSGVDCVGFVQRSSSYAMGRNYNWERVGGNLTEGGDDERAGIFGYPRLAHANDYSIRVAAYNFLDILFNPINLDLIKPGDVVFYGPRDENYNGTSHGAHIMMVNSVDQTGDGPIVLRDIKLIESYYNGSANFVSNMRSLHDIRTRTWFVVRLEGVIE